MHARLLPVAAALLLSAAVAVSGAPYAQVYSDRYVLPKAAVRLTETGEPTADGGAQPWPVLPVDGDVYQALSVPVAGGSADAMWLLTTTGVFALTTQPPATATAVTFTGGSIPFSAGMRLAALQPQQTQALFSDATAAADVDGAEWFAGAPGAAASNATIALASSQAVYWVQCSDAVTCVVTGVATADMGSTVSGAALDPTTSPCTVWIGTDTGLYRAVCGAATVDADLTVQKVAVTSVDVLVRGRLDATGSSVAAGTADRVWLCNVTTGTWRFEWVQCAFDDAVTALSFDQRDGTLWIGNDQALNVQYPNTDFDRFGALQGLPTGNHTCATTAITGNSQGLWLGTETALIWYQPTGDASADAQPSSVAPPLAPCTFSPFRYFAGPRFLVDDFVVSVAVAGASSSPDTVVAVTQKGVSVFRLVVQTLGDKAASLEAIMPVRHDMLGFGLAGGCNLATFGNVSSWQPRSDDNNGLWTAVYLGSLSLRYATTQDEAARVRAWHYFEGLELLNNVTGEPGLMARSVWPAAQDPQKLFGGKWENSTVYPELCWKRDTSSDEVTGHQFVYPLVYQLVAQTPDEKARVSRVWWAQMHRIVVGGYRLIDITGVPTTWGVWDPLDLNDVEWWDSERGLNSFQLLTWLSGAWAASNDTEFLRSYLSLGWGDDSQYFQNIVNLKMLPPTNVNYSDDELTFLPYFEFFWSAVVWALGGGAGGSVPSPATLAKVAAAPGGGVAAVAQAFASGSAALGGAYDPSIMPYFAQSLRRTWRHIKPERMSLYTYITALALGVDGAGGQEALGHAEQQLQRWATELVSWREHNSVRWDIRISPDASRQGSQISATIIPPDENGLTKWNGGPYDLDGGSGYDEDDAGGFLLAYWMGRYLGFLSD